MSGEVLAEAEVETNPNLALIKYWGKKDLPRQESPQNSPFENTNRPATSSLGVSLDGLTTKSSLFLLRGGESTLRIDGKDHSPESLTPLLFYLDSVLGFSCSLQIESHNDFASSAGLASSSSGGAASTLAALSALNRYLGRDKKGEGIDLALASRLAREGSGSAARAVFGGFCTFPEGDDSAHPLYDETHWPELRILVVQLSDKKKALSSRLAMERCKQTSVNYPSWLKRSSQLYEDSLQSLKERDLNHLGPLMQESYLLMFSTMLTAQPPIFYWLPETVQLLKELQRWRQEGMTAWETMDAGPQVKIFTVENELEDLENRIRGILPQATLFRSKIAKGHF